MAMRISCHMTPRARALALRTEGYSCQYECAEICLKYDHHVLIFNKTSSTEKKILAGLYGPMMLGEMSSKVEWNIIQPLKLILGIFKSLDHQLLQVHPALSLSLIFLYLNNPIFLEK